MRIPGGRDEALHTGALACFAAAIVAGAFFVSSAAGSAAAPAVDSEPSRVTTTTTTTRPSGPVPALELSPPTTPVALVALVETAAQIEPVAEQAELVVIERADAPAPVETTVATTTVVVTSVETTETPETVDVNEPAPTNQSTCRADLPGAVMTIAMPDIGYWCPVYAGGQSVIDAGVATVITAKESSFALADGPGAPGTLWITGHRSSHGGPFAGVPDLADGAIVTVSDPNGSASYVIVGRSYVEVRDGLAVDASGQTTEAATLDAVLRPDRNAGLAPRLLLQTCDAEDFRWMIYADLIEA